MLRMRVLNQAQRQPARPVLTASLDLAARLPRLILEARRVSASVHGIHGRRRAGPGETFWQYRPLVAGESAARIDWRRSARDGHLFVREREWEASHTVWLWIDRSASMGFASSLALASKIDRALVAGFALAETLVEGGERVGHLGLTRPLSPRNIIELLAQAIVSDRKGTTDDLPPPAPLPRLADAIIVTDGLSPSDSLARRIATMASSGARGHVLLVADPIEETFPFTGQAELFDLEDGLSLRVGDAGSWGDEYRGRLAAHREAIREACRKAGWTLTLHRTDRPASEGVLRVASLVAAARGGSGF